MLLLGFLISLYLAYTGFKRGSLSAGGGICAVLVGTLVFGLGGTVAGLALIGFYLSSTALSRHRKQEKQRLTDGIVEKGGRRDALQVLANGGPATLFCLLAALCRNSLWQMGFSVGALGALAAANSDTWATEIGLLSSLPPRNLLSFQKVAPGTSGAVTSTGLWGGLLGALVIGLLPMLESASGGFGRGLAVTIGGLAGGIFDSLLGAIVQERRQCLTCGAMTEQMRHACSENSQGETICIGGIAGLNNDAVNALASAFGGAVATLLYMLVARLFEATG